MATSNALNISQAGVVSFDGSAIFTGSVLTQHDVLVGGSSNAITSVSPSTSGFVLTSNGVSSDPSFQAVSASGAITTVTGNSGGAESPLAGNFNVLGTGSITVAGSANTETVQLTGLTNHNVLVGAGTATITNVGPSATAGIPLVSGGSSADPSFTTAVVPGGGTGVTTMTTAYAPVCAGTTATGNLQVASTGLSTSGFVLTSTGGSSLPTFQTVSASGAITTITGNSGGAESPSSGNFNIVGTGSITVAGTANTETVQLTGLTNHALQIGAGTSTLTQLGSGTTGQILQTNTSADPTWSTATYPSTAGTSGNVLTSDGTNIVSTTPSSIGASLTLLATTTASSSASIAFSSSVITTKYRVYLLIWSRMIAQTGATTLQLTFSTDNGSTYISTGYQGTTQAFSWNLAVVNNNNTTSNCPLTQATGFSNSTEASGYIYLYDLAISGTPTVLGMFTENSNVYGITGCGLTTTNTVNNIKIASSSGNLASGTIALYGVS